MGLGNGMVEAVCNPLVASMYPQQKTKMLNQFHLWWPAGIVIGSIVFVAAAIFAIGITLFWPTTLAFISENMPQSGAFGLSIMGGLGTLSIAAVLPVMGHILDNAVGTEAIRTMSILPAILIVLYGGLFFFRRSSVSRITE